MCQGKDYTVYKYTKRLQAAHTRSKLWNFHQNCRPYILHPWKWKLKMLVSQLGISSSVGDRAVLLRGCRCVLYVSSCLGLDFWPGYLGGQYLGHRHALILSCFLFWVGHNICHKSKIQVFQTTCGVMIGKRAERKIVPWMSGVQALSSNLPMQAKKKSTWMDAYKRRQKPLTKPTVIEVGTSFFLVDPIVLEVLS